MKSEVILAANDLTYDVLDTEARSRVDEKIAELRNADSNQLLTFGIDSQTQVTQYASEMLTKISSTDKVENIEYNEYGKPYLKGENIHFNLSHSGDYVLLAIDEFEVGVDIEKISTIKQKVADKYFTLQENSWLKDNNENENFYYLWTGKESVIKAKGQGLKNTKTFCLLPINNCIHEIMGEQFFLNWAKIEDYVYCVCSKTNSPIKLTILTKKDLIQN